MNRTPSRLTMGPETSREKLAPGGTATLPQLSRPTAETSDFAQDAAVNSRIKQILPEIGRQVAARLSQKPLAVLLTGSFARGEGSALLIGKRLRSLSDMEFLVLCPSGSDLRSVQQALDDQTPRLTNWLASRDIECELEFNAVDEKYLSRLRPHIFGYELLTHARTLWGDENILASAPRFPASAIPRWDAWRMLNNRLLEQLQWAEVSQRCDSAWLQSASYHILKCYLDLATIVLILEGRYRNQYADRAVALAEWASEASQDGVAFAGALAYVVACCTEFKLRPNAARFPLGINLEQDPRQLSAEVRCAMIDLVSFAHQVWRWAAISFVGLAGESRPEDETLREAVMRSQPLHEKLRGWAKITLMPEVRKQPRFARGAGKLLFKASPRYLIYSVASSLYFHLPEAIMGGAPEAREQEHLLPVRFTRHSNESRAWWRLRADVLLSWKLFLRNHWA
jgi:hypothetical protein